MKKIISILLAIILIATSAVMATSKEDIIKLAQAGTRDDVIITHLKAQAELVLSPKDIEDLQAAGVGEKVISFLTEYGGDMTKLNPPTPIYHNYYYYDSFDAWKYGRYNYYDYYWFVYGPYWNYPGHNGGHGHCH